MSRLLIVLFSTFWFSLPAFGQAVEAENLIASNELDKAIQLLSTNESTLNAEEKRLLGVALGRKALKIGGSIDDDIAHQAFLEKNKKVGQLLRDAFDQGSNEAAVDLYLWSLIEFEGNNSHPNVSYWLDRASESGGAPGAAFSFIANCKDDTPISEADIRFFESKIPKNLDADTKANWHTLYISLDDDQVAFGMLSDLFQAAATGSCVKRDKLKAINVLRKLLSIENEDLQIGHDIVSTVEKLKEDGHDEFVLELMYLLDGSAAKGARLQRSLFSYFSNIENKYFDMVRANRNLAEMLETLGTEIDDPWASLMLKYLAIDYIEKYEDKTPSANKVALEHLIDREATAQLNYAKRILEKLNEIGEYDTYLLAKHYLNGDFGTVEAQLGISTMERAARSGDDSAGYALAHIFLENEVVPINYPEATYWMARSAATNNNEAKYNMGWILSQEDNPNRNLTSAFEWYLKAAEAGYQPAFFKVAFALHFGEGVLENDREAARWYIKSADLGEGHSQRNLGFMYQEGEGVPQDYVKAYMWFNLAAARDISGAADAKNKLSRIMSRNQIDEAQRLSAKWQPGKTNHTFSSTSQTQQRLSARPKSTADTDMIKTAQQSLKAFGFYNGPIDGIAGSNTEKAVRKFQEYIGEPITGKIDSELILNLGTATGILAALDSDEPEDDSTTRSGSSGTGFYVSSDGLIVTNAHVAEGCKNPRLASGDALSMRDLDNSSDLALLSSSNANTVPLVLRSGRGIRLGSDVVVAGFPLRGILSDDLNVTTGSVSALSGPNNDRRLFQLTAPVQPGNSGGPILDESGNLVGVIVSKLDALSVAATTGDIPQNVNFGISLGTLQSFLDANSVDYETSSSSLTMSNSDVASIAKKSTVSIICE